MRKIYIIVLILTFIHFFSISSRALTFEKCGFIKTGINLGYPVVLGEYGREYKSMPGFLIYATGLYQARFDNGLRIYPEAGWGMQYLSHKTESGRRMLMFPFTINAVFNTSLLDFTTNIGKFSLRPYAGFGLYLNSYKSARTGSTGGDLGYQLGINAEYAHREMKDFYLIAGIGHYLVTNFSNTLPAISFTLGAGYTFNFRENRDAAAPPADKDNKDSPESNKNIDGVPSEKKDTGPGPENGVEKQDEQEK
ncbi:MAG: porin family protein [Spirochaetes bacterium]|jgi:hypothetical protein|nr:porin family protein [Spirochaetota bacterium]